MPDEMRASPLVVGTTPTMRMQIQPYNWSPREEARTFSVTVSRWSSATGCCSSSLLWMRRQPTRRASMRARRQNSHNCLLW